MLREGERPRGPAGQDRGGRRRSPSPSRTAQLLIEADLLDKIGPIGVTATILLCGHNGEFWQSIDSRIRKYVIGRGERALDHPLITFTPTGRGLVEERLTWTRRFLEDMKEDIACVF